MPSETSIPSHVDLLTTARAVRQAAVNDDLPLLHAELSRLRTDLVHHLHAEQQRLSRVAGPGGDLVRDGQHRLLDILNAVVFDAGSETGNCNCLVRAAEIEAALRRQARLEARLVDR